MNTVAFAVLAQLSIGGVALGPADFLDGRAIADGAGKPVVMLTLTPAALSQIKSNAAKLDERPVVARIADAVVELGGQLDFASAKLLAKALSGKDPLPESLDD